MIGTDFGTGLCLDGNLHVVDHEVHFDTTIQLRINELLRPLRLCRNHQVGGGILFQREFLWRI